MNVLVPVVNSVFSVASLSSISRYLFVFFSFVSTMGGCLFLLKFVNYLVDGWMCYADSLFQFAVPAFLIVIGFFGPSVW
jgi:hypothetical protein